MLAWLRRGLIWTALYAIALQSILAGVAAPHLLAQSAAAAVICHSPADGEDDNVPPAHKIVDCEHCILCTGVVAADKPATKALGDPPSGLSGRIAAPLSATAPARLRASLPFARGPPAS